MCGDWDDLRDDLRERDPDEFDEAFECAGCGRLVKLPEDYPWCYWCRQDNEDDRKEGDYHV